MKINVIKAEEGTSFDLSNWKHSSVLECIPVEDGCTPTLFILVTLPASKETAQEHVTIETFCSKDALPASTLGELKGRDETASYYLSFRDPVRVDYSSTFTVKVTDGDYCISRVYDLTFDL